jgi:hypothetical protein
MAITKGFLITTKALTITHHIRLDHVGAKANPFAKIV